jgi:DNA polymerase-1
MTSHGWTSVDFPCTVAPVRVIETELGLLRVVSTLEDAACLWDWTRERRGRWLGLDDETNAHDPFSPTYLLRTVQVADKSSGWVIQVQRPDMPEVVRTIVSAHDFWMAWFARNDIIFTERGVPGAIRRDSYHPHVADGQVALAYYDPRTVTTASKKDNIDPRISRPKGLKPAGALNLGFDYLTRAEEIMHAKFRAISPKGYGAEKAWKPYGFEHIDDNDEDYLIYAGLDSIVACRLWNKMLPEIYARGQWEAFQKDLRLQWHYDLALGLRGMPLDGPYVDWLDNRLAEIIEENRRLLGYYHIPPSAQGASIGNAFNWLAQQGYLRTDNTKKTKSGGVCWDKTVLENIVKEEPDTYAGILATSLLAVRKAAKFRSSYVKPMKEGLTRDGRLHPDLRAIGTISSRNACARPPMQQPPKREKKLKVRTAIVAPPGWVLVTADLQQGEPRVMAGLSGDLNLKRDLLEGDLYSSIANLTYGARYLGKDEGKKAGTDSYVMRQAAKFAFLAWGYGCGAAKLAGLLGITVAEAQAALRRWEAAYPDLIRFRNRVNQQPAAFLESGWIAPLWDRYFVDDKGIHLSTKPSRLGLNYYTQGSQAYLLRVALHRIIDWGWSWALFHTMHDEILLCVPAHMGDQAAQVLKAAMSMDWHGIPIECDVDKPPYSQRWAEYPDDYLLSANDIVNEFDEDLSELLGV